MAALKDQPVSDMLLLIRENTSMCKSNVGFPWGRFWMYYKHIDKWLISSTSGKHMVVVTGYDDGQCSLESHCVFLHHDEKIKAWSRLSVELVMTVTEMRRPLQGSQKKRRDLPLIKVQFVRVCVFHACKTTDKTYSTKRPGVITSSTETLIVVWESRFTGGTNARCPSLICLLQKQLTTKPFNVI